MWRSVTNSHSSVSSTDSTMRLFLCGRGRGLKYLTTANVVVFIFVLFPLKYSVDKILEKRTNDVMIVHFNSVKRAPMLRGERTAVISLTKSDNKTSGLLPMDSAKPGLVSTFLNAKSSTLVEKATLSPDHKRWLPAVRNLSKVKVMKSRRKKWLKRPLSGVNKTRSFNFRLNRQSKSHERRRETTQRLITSTNLFQIVPPSTTNPEVEAFNKQRSTTKIPLKSQIDQPPTFQNFTENQTDKKLQHTNSKKREDATQPPRPPNHLTATGNSLVFEVSKSNKYQDVQLPEFVLSGRAGDPGEYGIPYKYPLDDLSPLEKDQKEGDFDVNFFDEWTSRKIAVHRTLPDSRNIQCKNKTINRSHSVSVLVVFHNEAWSTLLRTVHSILDRTPPDVLTELLLLDDHSDQTHLGVPLESYLKTESKVRLLRVTERLGLVKARNLAFQQSVGDIVVFLDSHVECFPGWLEPLVSPITDNYRTVTFPLISNIDAKTFSIVAMSRPYVVGGINMRNLNFHWIKTAVLKHAHPWTDVPSPTMPGGLYAISRRWFSELGQYDPGLVLWGGENIEMSFKVWMCGGRLLQVSCSHVGHIFRSNNPAWRDRGSIIYPGNKNSIRVAEVWMDSYKHYFYENIAYNINDFGDIKDRLKLRETLKCSNFSWYVDNVYPELKQVIDEGENIYLGQIKNVASMMCLDRSDDRHVHLQKCKTRHLYQNWKLSRDGRLVSGDRAVGVQVDQQMGKHTFVLGLYKTARNNAGVQFEFLYDKKHRLRHKGSSLCLQGQTTTRDVMLQPCSDMSRAQRWLVHTRREMRHMLKGQNIPIDWTL